LFGIFLAWLLFLSLFIFLAFSTAIVIGETFGLFCLDRNYFVNSTNELNLADLKKKCFAACNLVG